MIELYTGTPGSGKSLHCAEIIYKRIIRKKNVIANFDVNMTVFPEKKKLGLFLHLDNSEINPDLLMQLALSYHKRSPSGHIIEGQTLLVIDECQILFNSRDWQAPDRMKWATFFTQHRKYGYNIILITQFDRLIDRQIRSLVEYQVIHRKISNFKTIGFFIGLIFRGNIFVAITQWYGVKEKVDSEIFVLRPKYAHMYDSYHIFGGPAEPGIRGPGETMPPKRKIKEPKKQKRKKTKKRDPIFYASKIDKIESFSEFWEGPHLVPVLKSESGAVLMNNKPLKTENVSPIVTGYRASNN